MKSKIALLGLLSLYSGVGMAADSNWYFGLRAGTASGMDVSQSSFKRNLFRASVGLRLSVESSSVEDTGTSWSLIEGYTFSNHFAMEFGYTDLGSISYRQSGHTAFPVGPNPLYNYDADLSARGLELALAGTQSLGKYFELHGKLGLLVANTELKESVIVNGSSFPSTSKVSASSLSGIFGIGATYKLANHFGVTVDWILYSKVGDEDKVGQFDTNVLSAGMIYRF